ncbi:hypothetical protein [Streptomyces sp. NPDC093568]|uniref:hypothetical protein n=1 Tax=Streptomyces sp. NPDC093568 TaxID=3366041 RepID=UPI0038102C1F
MTWVPTACTLPTAEQPLRVAEFDALFSDTLTSASTPAPTRVQFVLDDDEATEERARELAARETECCSFFTFGFDRDSDGRLLMGITVPEAHSAVLAALADRANAAAAS